MPAPDAPCRLIEPSCADMLQAIASDPGLSDSQRVHLACSTRVICEMQGRPLELCPARWTAQRGPTSRLHHTQRPNMMRKTLKNHLANFKWALARFAGEAQIPRRGVRLNPEWECLHRRIQSQRTRALLSGLMRFCSARGVDPPAADEAIVDAYMDYRAATTNLKADAGARRRIARAWNACISRVNGWPTHRLCEPPIKPLAGPPLDQFPIGLRADIEGYLQDLTRVRKNAAGRRCRPCKPGTIAVRRAMLIALARRAVALGAPIEGLKSLADLLAPDLVQRCLDSYWPPNQPKPTIYSIDLAALLVSIARTTGCLEADELSHLDDMRFTLEEDRPRGLTDKNLTLIRQVLSPGIWKGVVALPHDLMQQARAVREQSPTKAAVLAQLAAAIALLTVAPVRLGNLAAIALDRNLLRPNGAHSPYWLVFPDYDVKNRVRLEFVLDPRVHELVDEYVHNHLAVLRRGSNQLYLFPGQSRGHKGAATLSAQITKCVAKATGLRHTVHQFRHAAAAVFLSAKPGNFELVRQILGHKSIKTTMDFYVGLETTQATRIFAEIVHGELDFDCPPL